MSRSVLILAYQFPPIGGAGVIRALKLARYLPDHGWEPVIVCGPGRPDFAWTPGDESLLAEIGTRARVERIATPEPPAPGRLRRVVERALDQPSAIDRWWIDGAAELARRVGADTDVILCELGPYETAYAAERAARALGLPWIADLQDPWALDEMWVYPTALHRARDLRRMRAVLGTTAGVIMNAPEALARLRSSFPELEDRLLTAIPNGFDPADFADPAPARDDGAFRIVHTGTMHTEFALRTRRARLRRRVLGGMAFPDVDYLTRSHVFLLEALAEIVAEEPSLAATIELHLAGALSRSDRDAMRDAPVRIVEHEFVSHGEAIRLMRGADLLFLPMQRMPEGTRAGIVPAKTYEYLASGAPILAAVPAGDARDLLEEAGNAAICEPADTAGIKRAVLDRLASWRAGATPAAPRGDVVERYAWPRHVAAIAEVLDAVSGTPSRQFAPFQSSEHGLH